MEAPWLASQLDAGRSIESIAREAGLSPSTVAYWVNKHGLTSQHAERHRARGGLTREQLEPLVEAGVPIREIAEQLGVSYTHASVTGSAATACKPCVPLGYRLPPMRAPPAP